MSSSLAEGGAQVERTFFGGPSSSTNVCMAATSIQEKLKINSQRVLRGRKQICFDGKLWLYQRPSILVRALEEEHSREHRQYEHLEYEIRRIVMHRADLCSAQAFQIGFLSLSEQPRVAQDLYASLLAH